MIDHPKEKSMKKKHLGRTAFAVAGFTLLMVSTACSSTTASSAGSSSSAGASSLVASGASSGTPASSPAGPAGSASAPAGSAATLPAAQLSILIGSSGPAETDSVTAAAAAWGKSSGSTATVTAAQDLGQQLAQGFSSGKAPDIFYLGADQVANYAKAGNLLAYADKLTNAADFYPSLTASFTYDGKFYCAPKDFSTLALFINSAMWAKAGLTAADIPKNWDQLEAVAKKLTAGKVAGLSMSPEHDRLDAFMVQNGSYLVDAAGKPTVNSDQNVAALTYAKKLYTDGSLKFPKDLGAGWAGEAFGKGEAAMTIEGNWLLGAMSKDYPSVKYQVAELPTGPSGTKGTLSFTNCWGISATTKNAAQAEALVTYLTSTQQQLIFAKAFGVIPSVKSAASGYLAQNPANAPFVNGVAYAKGVLNAPGITDVMTDFNSQLQGLPGGDPKTILDSVQGNLQTALGGS
jgi:multiple sugar transport system substrate-binding protein